MSKPSIGGRYPVKQVPVTANTAASHELVEGVSGKSIRVVSLFLVCADAVNVSFLSDDGSDPLVLTGVMSFGANGGIALAAEDGWFWTRRGDALDMLLGGGVQVSGALTYILE